MTAQYWLLVIERCFKQERFTVVSQHIRRFQSFCNKYALLAYRFESELVQCDVLIAVGEIEQAMVQLSQTIASLDQHPHSFYGLRLKAMTRVTQLKALRDETLLAFVEIQSHLLG